MSYFVKSIMPIYRNSFLYKFIQLNNKKREKKNKERNNSGNRTKINIDHVYIFAKTNTQPTLYVHVMNTRVGSDMLRLLANCRGSHGSDV